MNVDLDLKGLPVVVMGTHGLEIMNEYGKTFAELGNIYDLLIDGTVLKPRP